MELTNLPAKALFVLAWNAGWLVYRHDVRRS
jgi:hypothetical protein